MAKYRAIPDGYMTVGEVAKKMGITVRTMQYYDKEGLLSPSAESEGGRRLYTDKDLVMLLEMQRKIGPFPTPLPPAFLMRPRGRQPIPAPCQADSTRFARGERYKK